MSRKVPATQLVRSECEVVGDDELHELIVKAAAGAANVFIRDYNVQKINKDNFARDASMLFQLALEKAAVKNWWDLGASRVDEIRQAIEENKQDNRPWYADA